MYGSNSIFSSDSSDDSMGINGQIAGQIFETISEHGPVMVIWDRQGHCWSSDAKRYSELNIDDLFFCQLLAKVDDGDEPVISQTDDVSIIGAQIATEQTNCGYVIIAFPKSSPESVIANTDLIEMLINQINLIARLIEKSNKLYQAGR